MTLGELKQWAADNNITDDYVIAVPCGISDYDSVWFVHSITNRKSDNNLKAYGYPYELMDAIILTP